MLNFADVKQMIYFPRKFERKQDPVIVFVIEHWGDSWKGNVELSELLKNKFQFYPLRRCQPYSDELWTSCQAWTRRRQELMDDFAEMMERGVGR